MEEHDMHRATKYKLDQAGIDICPVEEDLYHLFGAAQGIRWGCRRAALVWFIGDRGCTGSTDLSK